ncbi:MULTISPECIES: K(+)-transporting ATPase subunit F [Microbacterium]|jgi:K+-transporting ATPase KdpF subunit|uniref:K(+)-transporting ATPase subunit F n=1 Tax=Microbacterium schleiferi TaxID=69362 RepID=A0ABU7VA53_9MICO|nr:K(+)-transporting ATPase subunit F [Microbacterium sp. 67-17]MBD3751989.1 K(+)-transporting ATPase subunit F [Micrococcales bacterium]OJV98858.1 MAG: potassium-transporting ATPase subunit F [Microbacterium sp. 67-17]
MIVFSVLAVTLAVASLIYLIVALLNPERF